MSDPATAPTPTPTPTPLPELAGLATYGDAARVGIPVEENVRRLLRYHWVERRLRHAALAHIAATPEWEVKCALSLHQWLDAEHADWLRTRIAEMRNPLPRMDAAPDPALDSFLDEVIRPADTVELLVGVHRVARSALAAAYREHIARTNPLVDHPTRRLLRRALLEEEESLEWSERAIGALCANDATAAARAAAWERHLRAYLAAAGGIHGDDVRPDAAALPPPRATLPFHPDTRPRRDQRFAGQYNFNFPPHLVYNMPDVPPDERNLALVCKRTLEMDVPEMMASILLERPDEPWEFHLDYSRQLWDEARHAMMGTVWFAARGVDWTRIPLNVGFSLRLNQHASALERQVMLYGIEQTLMPGETGKRFEYETARAAGDELSAHFHDYDWADEVLHARIGRRWVKREGISTSDAIEQAKEIHERTWAELDRYKDREPQAEWWADFVRAVLGRESAVDERALGEVKVVSG